jgi:hypothetical protein
MVRASILSRGFGGSAVTGREAIVWPSNMDAEAGQSVAVGDQRRARAVGGNEDPRHGGDARGGQGRVQGELGKVAGLGELTDQDYAGLLQNYRDLAQGVNMIRDAVEQTFGLGVLPSGEYTGATPVEDCEASFVSR